jgi:hypothetical protein
MLFDLVQWMLLNNFYDQIELNASCPISLKLNLLEFLKIHQSTSIFEFSWLLEDIHKFQGIF